MNVNIALPVSSCSREMILAIANSIAMVCRTEYLDDSVLRGVNQLIKAFERSLVLL
jgi:uncharacterized ion transporter superfamily protein YfcC